jgi:hypothetical protein
MAACYHLPRPPFIHSEELVCSSDHADSLFKERAMPGFLNLEA